MGWDIWEEDSGSGVDIFTAVAVSISVTISLNFLKAPFICGSASGIRLDDPPTGIFLSDVK